MKHKVRKVEEAHVLGLNDVNQSIWGRADQKPCHKEREKHLEDLRKNKGS